MLVRDVSMTVTLFSEGNMHAIIIYIVVIQKIWHQRSSSSFLQGLSL